MKIFKGGIGKDFADNSHKVVDDRSLSGVKWHSPSCGLIEVNLSKTGNKKMSVGHILFEPSDALYLLKGMIERQIEDRKSLERSEEKSRQLQKALLAIRNLNSLEKVKEKANEALGFSGTKK